MCWKTDIFKAQYTNVSETVACRIRSLTYDCGGFLLLAHDLIRQELPCFVKSKLYFVTPGPQLAPTY